MRRPSSISSEAASTTGRSFSAREITAGSPASSAEVGITGSKPGTPSIGGGQFGVDLLHRLALGLQPEEIIDHPGHQEPAAEIEEGGRELRQRHVGLEVVARAYDQGEAGRADDLA